MRFRKRAAVLSAAGLLAAAGITGCSGSLDTDAVVATVGGEDILLGVANFYARMQQGEYETYYASVLGTTGDEMWTQEYSENTTLEEETKNTILESLEDMYIISQHAEEYDIALTDDENDAIADAAAQLDEDNTSETKEAVSGYRKYVEKLLQLATIQTKMDSAMREGVDEEVSDEEAAQKGMEYAFFPYTTTDDDGNSVDLTDEEKEGIRAKAQAFADELGEGADSETAAEAAGVEVQVSTFDSESTSPNSDLIAAADALENEGDVTGIVETDNGIYVARLTSLLDREATDREKESIVEQRRQDQYDSLLEQWRNDADIQVDENVWDKVDFEEQGVTIITSPAEEGTSDGAEETAEDQEEGNNSDSEADSASDETDSSQ